MVKLTDGGIDLKDGGQALEHQFLIPMPIQDGTYFERTVVYICLHGDQGAFGVVVNRPIGIDTDQEDDPLSQALVSMGREGYVIAGGPVDPQQLLMLHSADWLGSKSFPIRGNLAMTFANDGSDTFHEALSALKDGAGPKDYLLSVGFAGWGPGQLESELEENAWITSPFEHDLLFELPYENRYSQAFSSLGFDGDMLAFQGGEA